MNLIFQLNYGCVVAGLEGGRIKSSIMNMLNGYANLWIVKTTLFAYWW